MTRKYIKEEKLRYHNTNPSYDNIEKQEGTNNTIRVKLIRVSTSFY